MAAHTYILTPAAFAALSPAAQAEVLRVLAPPPAAAPPEPAICLLHPPPRAPDEPAPLGYSRNSRGEYSMYAPPCCCPPEVAAARAEEEAAWEAERAGAAAGPAGGGPPPLAAAATAPGLGLLPALAADGGEESPAPGPLGPAHNTSGWDRMRAAAEELEEAIATAREMEPAAFEATLNRCAYQLEFGNPVVERARALLEELRVDVEGDR